MIDARPSRRPLTCIGRKLSERRSPGRTAVTRRAPAMRSGAQCSSQRRQYSVAMFRSVRPPQVFLGMLLLVPVAAQADFYDQPFAMRLLFAVDRQSNYSSTLARQASVAALEGGSANPGAAAWREPLDPTTTVTTSFVYAPSGGGREVIAAPVSLRWQAQGHGTIALAYAFTDTRDAGGDNGLTQSLRSDEWIGGYGRRVGEHAAVGFTVRLTSGTIVGDSRTAALGDQPIRASTRFLAPDVSMGYAAEISRSVTIGITAGYGRARAETSVTNLAPFMVSLPPAGIPVTSHPVRCSSNRTRSFRRTRFAAAQACIWMTERPSTSTRPDCACPRVTPDRRIWVVSPWEPNVPWAAAGYFAAAPGSIRSGR